VNLIDDHKAGNSSPVEIRHLVLRCDYNVKESCLRDVVELYGRGGRTLIFTETKAQAHKLGLALGSQALHGDIPQEKRESVLAAFREGKFTTMVATNVAARGLDIPKLDLVVLLQPPENVETYIHRAGRTGRAGRAGTVLTMVSRREEAALQNISHRCKINFTSISPPQPSDLDSAAASSAVDRVEQILASPHRIGLLEPFTSQSEKLLASSSSASEIVAAALALICGVSDKPRERRSLLSGQTGFATIHLQNPQRQIRSPRFVCDLIMKALPEGAVDLKNIHQVRVGPQDGPAQALADVPREVADQLVELSETQKLGYFSVELPVTIPEGFSAEPPPSSSWGGSTNAFRGNGRGGGGWQGRGGGRGGGGGGGGWRDRSEPPRGRVPFGAVKSGRITFDD